ncbi:MAG TPA: EAL domain-containing protein [Usitatibacter sp.]|nr:EAL domain-containing protein [Usitatibacter sp.]
MGRLLLFAIAAFLCALVGAAAPSPAAMPAEVERLVVVTDDHYPPYLFRDEDGALQGIVKDRWALWSQRNAIPVEVRGTDWASAQRDLREGRADVIDSLAYTEERASSYAYSLSHDNAEARLFFHRGLTGITGLESVRHMPVAVKRGSACGDRLRAAGVQAIEEFPDSQALVKAAAAGIVRVFCMDTYAARYFLFQERIAEDFRETEPVYTATLHWAVRADQPRLLAYIEGGYAKIEPGELARIDAKWLGHPMRSPLDVRYLYALAAIPVALVAFSLLLLVWSRFLRLRVEARTRYYSTRDALTGLPTRPLLHDRLGQALAQAGARNACVAVFFVDLDRFKSVNDTYGHVGGDRVLKEVAERLQRMVGKSDTVSRISSDEFVLVVASFEKAGDAAGFAGRVLCEMQRPIDIDSSSVVCTASIGIAVHPGDGTTAGALIRNSDIAMFRAKKRGRNNFQFFLPEMHENAVRRVRLEMALRGALAKNEFMVHYQPKIDVRTGSVTGFEALLRWRHPEFGLLSPADFVPVLEESDLIAPVGEWVLRTACRQIATWAQRGLAPRPIAVNLSARQFRMDHLDAMVARVITETGVDPQLLELELTESLLMDNPEQTVVTLGNLRRYGVRLAVDDFGTGYSSLAYLKRFPIDALKIDRAFISDATTNPEDAAITLAIINLGHSLGLKVVAEGVETESQLQFLRDKGCDEMQGFFFSPAVSADELESLLRRTGGAAPAQVPAAISLRSQSTNWSAPG